MQRLRTYANGAAEKVAQVRVILALRLPNNSPQRRAACAALYGRTSPLCATEEASMAEYEHAMTIDASPDAVFDFVADIRNLPKYLPTTKSAQPQGEERVRVQGEAAGHQYDFGRLLTR